MSAARTVLITGCSSGLGLSLTTSAAAAGMTVFATMRDLAKRQHLDAALSSRHLADRVTVLPLDVTSTASVADCVAAVLRHTDHIDVLVNNAGIGMARTTEQVAEADVQRLMDANFMGMVRCTKAVLPHMRQARRGKVVAVSSVGGLVGQPFNEVYCASKFAVEGYMEALASYVTDAFNVYFTVVEPGGIASEFAKTALAHMEATGGIVDDEYKPIFMRYVANAQKRAGNDSGSPVFQTPEQVAEVVMDVIKADKPPIRVRTSTWAEDLCRLKTEADPDGWKLQEKVASYFLGGDQ